MYETRFYDDSRDWEISGKYVRYVLILLVRLIIGINEGLQRNDLGTK